LALPEAKKPVMKRKRRSGNASKQSSYGQACDGDDASWLTFDDDSDKYIPSEELESHLPQLSRRASKEIVPHKETFSPGAVELRAPEAELKTQSVFQEKIIEILKEQGKTQQEHFQKSMQFIESAIERESSVHEQQYLRNSNSEAMRCQSEAYAAHAQPSEHQREMFMHAWNPRMMHSSQASGPADVISVGQGRSHQFAPSGGKTLENDILIGVRIHNFYSITDLEGVSSISSGPSLIDLIQFKKEGLLNDEEFTAAKRKLLGLS